MKKVKIKKKCNSKMEFGDDYGDNSTTFHCQLEKNHTGIHREYGELEGHKYRVTWWD